MLYSKKLKGKQLFLRWHPVSKALNAKIDLATPKRKNFPAAKKQQELHSEQQQANKGSRNTVLGQIRMLDEQLKSRTMHKTV